MIYDILRNIPTPLEKMNFFASNVDGMNVSLLIVLLAFGYQTASAASLLETFGSGDNAFSMEFVTIGNPGNAPDTTGNPNPVGSVAYVYNIGKYEVSREQIDKANAAGSLGISLQNMSSYGGNGLLKPATGISFYEAAGYANWLNESKGYQAAYKFVAGTFQLWSPTDSGYNANNKFRNSLAKYVITSSDEWYKAAYGKLDGTWYDYATGSDSAPTAAGRGTAANTAVFDVWSLLPSATSYGPADINNAGGLSAFGTMAQGGNVSEWVEDARYSPAESAGDWKELRGGHFQSSDSSMTSSSWREIDEDPASEFEFAGFRVVSVPEPSTGLLVVLGLSGLLLKRRK